MTENPSPKPIKGKAYDKLATPLARAEEHKAMMDFVEELSDDFVEHDEEWLKALGIQIEYDEGWIEFRKGYALLMIEAGPNMSLLVNNKPEQPEPSFYTTQYYNNLKQRLIKWAAQV